MNKLLGILLLLFSVQAYSTPLYVKLESDGDIVFSHTPIAETESDTAPKNKKVATATPKEKANQTPQMHADPIIAEVKKENLNHPHKVNPKVIAEDKNENAIHHAKTNPKPMTVETKSMAPIASPIMPISLPNSIPIIASVTEEGIHATHKSNVAEVTTETIQETEKPNTKTKAIIQPKDKSVIVDSTEEDETKTDHSAKAKAIIFPKNNAMIAKAKTKLVTSPKNKATDTPLTYKTFRITSPLNKEVVQNLLVDLKIEPKLKDDHKIQIFVDGKRISKPGNSTHINTDVAKKGSHEIYGLIIDKNKNFVMQSNVITVFIRPTKDSKTMQTATDTIKEPQILKTAIHKPLKMKDTKIIQAATYKPLRLKDVKSMQTATRKPLKTKDTRTIQRTIQTATYKPLRLKDVRTMRTASHKPLRLKNVKTMQTASHKPLRLKDVKTMQTASHKPLRLKDVKTMQTANHKPLKMKNSKTIQTAIHKSLKKIQLGEHHPRTIAKNSVYAKSK